MRRLAILFTLLLPASSLASPGNGIDLQWNDCVGGPASTSDIQFNCTGTVDQTRNLIFNFKVNQDIPEYIAITSYLQLDNTARGALAPFWHYEIGGCQRMVVGSPDGVTLSSAIPVSQHCTDNFLTPWGSDGSGGTGFISYTPDSPSPGRGVFVVVMASTGGATPITAGSNYYAFTLGFNNRNRSTCAGCAQQAGLTWVQAILESGDGSPQIVLSGTDKSQRCASFNGGVITCQCACTPVRNQTWGSLKALYR